MQIKILLLAIGAAAAFLLPGCRKSEEPLSITDRKELTTLADNLFADLEKGDRRNLAKYIEDVSLRKHMEEQRSFLKIIRDTTDSKRLARLFDFEPNLETILKEKDPKKFFAAIHLTEEGQNHFAPKRSSPAQILSIAGNHSKAFIIVGRVGDTRKSELPELCAWPAIRTAAGWRMDVTTTILENEKPIARPGEKLLPEDEKELREYTAILIAGRLSDFSRIFSEEDLVSVMEAQQAFIKSLVGSVGEYRLKNYFTFTTGLKDMLEEKNPANFFEGIQPRDEIEAASNEAFRSADKWIVGIAGDRKTSYILVQEPMEVPDDLSAPIQIYTARRNATGWHLDITTHNILGSLKFVPLEYEK